MTQPNRDKLIYLRQWVGDKVKVTTASQASFIGLLTNIVFDGTKLSYIMLDDKVLVNFDQIVDIAVQS
jgi:RNase P/RNase MRP subunit p29